MARREQKAVGILKSLVCFMLVVTVAAVGTGVYLFAESDEKNVFESTVSNGRHRSRQAM